jgi:hypothetical protein
MLKFPTNVCLKFVLKFLVCVELCFLKEKCKEKNEYIFSPCNMKWQIETPTT